MPQSSIRPSHGRTRWITGAHEPDAGTSLDRALRLTIYTTNLDYFDSINEAYAGFFGDEPPARAAIGVTELPRGAAVMIDAIVAI